MTFSIASPWGGGKLHTGLLGAFNVSNLLAAAGTLALLGMPWNQVMHQLEIMHPFPGACTALEANSTSRSWWWTMHTRRMPWSRL